MLRGALGFSVLRIWPDFGSVFRFSHLKLHFFGFGVMCGLRVFSNLVFGFRFLSTKMGVFQIFLSNAFSVLFVFFFFSGFAVDVTPWNRAKP